MIKTDPQPGGGRVMADITLLSRGDVVAMHTGGGRTVMTA